MVRRLLTRRTLGMIFLLVAPMAFLALAPQSAAPPKSNLVRGNAPGEWRYWGADAWSSRYSPLDQINATNFNSLQIAWQFKVGDMFGDDEYFRSTPLYANGKLISVAGGKRGVVALNPGDRRACSGSTASRKASAIRRRRGRTLDAGSRTGPTARNERVLVVTPGYHLVAIDAKTGVPDPKFGKDGVVDLMDGLGYPLVPLAVDDDGPLIISEGASGAQGQARRDVGSGEEDRRGRHGRHRSRARTARRKLAAIVVGDVIIVGNSAIHGYYPIRMHNLGGAIRGFDMHTGKQLWKFNTIPQPGEFGAETWENGSKIGTTASARSTRGRRTRPIPISASSTSRPAWA